MKLPIGRWMTVGLLAAVITVAPAASATIVPSDNQEVCLLSLTGVIESGDFERFLRAADKMFTPKEEVGESTASNTICLNSPGGSFVEGIQFAKHFVEEGVGTVIREDALCASACAMMFMMGRAVGSEVSFVNRKLHIGGQLGFHRPSLRLEVEGAFGSRDIETSYDMAVTSVVEFIALANRTAPWSSEPMVAPDLVEKIFATPGNEMYFVETVQQAARWNIELVGVDLPSAIDEERAYYACENALQWRVALQDEPLDFVGLNLMGHWTAAWSYRVDGGADRFVVTSHKSGYASAGCVVDFADGALRICGQDEYTGITLGRGSCEPDMTDGLEWISKLTMWPPETKLLDLNKPWRPTEAVGTCQVFTPAGTIIDSERCSVEVTFDYVEQSEARAVMTFTWPSGSRTRASYFGIMRELNGDAAQVEFVQDQDACFISSRTRNRFCFSAE